MSRLAKRVFSLSKSSSSASSAAAAAAAAARPSSSSSSFWRWLSPLHHHVSDKDIGARCFSSSPHSSSSAGYHVSPSSSMKGAVFRDPTRPLSLELLQIPRPQPGEVLIRTKACGVCRSDLHLLKGVHPFASPCVVGHEVTGEVVEHHPLNDPKIVRRFPVGSHVVGAFIMPCGTCLNCSKGHDDLCEDFFAYTRGQGTLYDGKTRLFFHGSGEPVYMNSMAGMAEYCIVLANALALLPGSLPYAESAILGCAAFTAYGAMTHAAEVRAGDSIAVIGVGGVGSSCLQLAKAFGASDVIAVDVSDEKLQKAKILGATHTVNTIKEDAIEKIKAITGGKGVDIAVEALGRPQTFMQCVQSVRDGGKAVMIGLAKAGAMGEVDINRLVRRKIKIVGSYGARARQDLPKLVRLAESGIFNLTSAVSRKYKFEEAGEAYQDLDQGKIVSRAIVEMM